MFTNKQKIYLQTKNIFTNLRLFHCLQLLKLLRTSVFTLFIRNNMKHHYQLVTMFISTPSPDHQVTTDRDRHQQGARGNIQIFRYIQLSLAQSLQHSASATSLYHCLQSGGVYIRWRYLSSEWLPSELESYSLRLLTVLAFLQPETLCHHHLQHLSRLQRTFPPRLKLFRRKGKCVQKVQ